MKKILSLFLALTLIVALGAAPASAAFVSGTEAVSALETLGLVRGTGAGFEPERPATRAETAVMLLRLLGLEDEAEESELPCPFYDAGWAASYLAFAADRGLVQGRTRWYFGRDDAVTARETAVLLLRALGYIDGEDFTWETALAFSDSIGLTHGEYTAAGEFLREDLALLCCTALSLPPKGGGETLIESLYLRGKVSGAALAATRFAGAVNAGKTPLTAAEIYARSASAVLFVEVYDSAEALEEDERYATGSAFFVTGDGVALMTYHELDGAYAARVTTAEGKRYDVTGVLYYDSFRDVAAVRVSRESIDGETVRFFPYLDLGDPDALAPGDALYTVSNPQRLTGSVSDGVAAAVRRVVDDPAYPCIQTTAPISGGSSGGPLFDRFGVVVGIIYASYTNGQNLNLAAPVDCLNGVAFTGEGTPLPEVLETENAKKAAAQLATDETELTLRVGEKRELIIRNDCPGQANMEYTIGDTDVISCAWGEFVTKQSCRLTVTGAGEGESELTVRFAGGDGNEEAELVISVTVLPGEDGGETEE